MKAGVYLFRYPLLIAVSIVAHLVLQYQFGYLFAADIAVWIGSGIGAFQLLHKTFSAILDRKLTLDYIAILAILVALFGHYYLVAAVIMLMLSGGYSLEEYGLATAKRSLNALISRIPTQATLWKDGVVTTSCPVPEIRIGDQILIRKGEVIPLDGVLFSEFAETDDSSITGEPYLMEKHQGDLIRSGTVNVGDAFVIQVTTTDQNSTYHHIIQMVQQAQLEKSPMIRLADQYSLIFLGLTLGLAMIAYWLSHDITRVLGVLVVATPCPLILATPIALMGGVNAASRHRMIVKRLGSLETLSRVQALIFDKTGTLTLGRPRVKTVVFQPSSFSDTYLVGVAAAIERNSLHPLAKALVLYATDAGAPRLNAHHVTEKIGVGISGTIDNQGFLLSKIPHSGGMTIGLYAQPDTLLARFEFADELKSDSRLTLEKLSQKGLQLFLFTGDQKDRTQALLSPLGLPIIVEAECSPEEKKEKILALSAQGKITAMIGDGINDAPALAAADVGMVFSHEEQTASTDAADVVFLGGDLNLVLDAIQLAVSTIRIAKQCIVFGISASVLAMMVAVFGYLPPIWGAFLQEGIDVVVILYALRTSFN